MGYCGGRGILETRRDPIKLSKYPGQIKDLTIDFVKAAAILGETTFANPPAVTWNQAPNDPGDVVIASAPHAPTVSGLRTTARLQGGTQDTEFWIEATFASGQTSRVEVLIQILDD